MFCLVLFGWLVGFLFWGVGGGGGGVGVEQQFVPAEAHPSMPEIILRAATLKNKCFNACFICPPVCYFVCISVLLFASCLHDVSVSTSLTVRLPSVLWAYAIQTNNPLVGLVVKTSAYLTVP